MFHFNDLPKKKGPTITCKRCKKQFVKINDFIICPQCVKETLGDASHGVQLYDQ